MLPAFPLFVPADRPERIAKACRAGPDGVIVDLEDAVAPDRKAGARTLPDDAREAGRGIALLVRVNALGTPWHAEDMAFAAAAGFDGIVLPKSEAPEAVHAARAALPETAIVIALIETATGLDRARDVARAADRLAFGSVDFAEDTGCAHTRQALLLARSALVAAARLAGRPAPIDGVTLAVRDKAAVADDARHALELGFGGKLLIHPAQVESALAAFCPSDDDVRWARRALEAGEGAALLDGAMIDAPLLARARRILARAAP